MTLLSTSTTHFTRLQSAFEELMQTLHTCNGFQRLEVLIKKGAFRRMMPEE